MPQSTRAQPDQLADEATYRIALATRDYRRIGAVPAQRWRHRRGGRKPH
ncbi:MAG: hypothetical protein JWO57_1214 [Pseudonocardiales bacterium]|nr:hypothetical protein [Pseudonocardiales bacterium]